MKSKLGVTVLDFEILGSKVWSVLIVLRKNLCQYLVIYLIFSCGHFSNL